MNKPAFPFIDENSILAKLKDGNQAAFKYFYDKYSLQLYRKLIQMVHEETIAEELLQDLFVKIWEKRNLVDPEQSFKAYLYKIAERIVYDHFRKLTREARLKGEFSAMSSELYSHTEENIFKKEAEAKIQAAIEKLPHQQKQVFTLCKIEGKSYEEVSKILGISVVTINTHITRATKTIKMHLKSNDSMAYILALSAAIHALPR